MAVTGLTHGRATMTDDWYASDLDTSDPGWVQVAETGWDALKLWCAGPDNRARAPRDRSGRTVQVIRETGGTPRRASNRSTLMPFASVEESIDSYLADGGVPPMPHGYRWYLRIPDGWTGDLVNYIDSQLNERVASEAPRPSEWLSELPPIMDEIYGKDRAEDQPAS